MLLAVAKEVLPGEARVALVPESVKKLTGAGFQVIVEHGSGDRSHFPDAAYLAAGATVAPSAEAALAAADMWVKCVVPAPPDGSGRHEIDLMRPDTMLLGSLMPLRHTETIRALATRRITSFSTDTIPRIARAQSMDTLSSMASIAGYKGVLLAATLMGKYTPMLMTAAGTILPARFFVIGAGVAGLQAIATAKRLGANVFATDVRPEVREQIESVGAKYVGIDVGQSAAAGGGYAKELSAEDRDRQRRFLAEQCALADVVITTALIGGMFAPKLITREMVAGMKPGSVIMDLAAEGGGNCELSQPGATVVHNAVIIAAPLNLPSSMSTHASVLWSRNMTSFLLSFWKDKRFVIDPADEIMQGALITHAGEIVHPRVKEALAAPAPAARG